MERNIDKIWAIVNGGIKKRKSIKHNFFYQFEIRCPIMIRFVSESASGIFFFGVGIF
jgi:hypothetical protein